MDALKEKRKKEKRVARHNSFVELMLLVRKNVILLLRSKTSALIILFAPLLLILLIGISYDSFVGYGLSIGVHADEFGPDVKALEQGLADLDYNAIEYETIEECLSDARQDVVHACLDLPNSFSITDNTAKEVVVYVDSSRLNLVGIVEDALELQFDLKSQELSEDLLDSLLGTVFDVKAGISSQANVLNSVKGSGDAVSSTISSAATTVGEGHENTLDVFERYLTGKLTSAKEYSSEIAGAVSQLDNITATEEEELEGMIANLNIQIENAEIQILSSSEYSFQTIRDILLGLETSLNSAGDANEELGAALQDLSSSINSLEGYVSELGGLQVTDSGTLSSPLVTRVETLSSEDSKFNFLFPSILALVGMFLSVMMANTLVMMEKRSPAYIRNVLLPISKAKFIFANFLSTLFLVALQMAVLLVMSLVFMEDVSFVSFPVMFVALLCGTAVFTLIGMVIGSIFSSEETSTLAAISTGSLFLFLSGVIVPLEGMAPELRGIVELNPYVLLEGVIRQEFIFQNPLMSYLEPLSLLLLYAVILFVVMLIFDIILHKNLIHKVLYAQHKRARKVKDNSHQDNKKK